ncbi:MAG: EthD family reductase [Sphingomicrobium sp.]
MYILTITYPNVDGATFDYDYYRSTHLPMVGEAFGPHGLGYASVLKGEGGADGSPPTFLTYAVFSFREEEGAKAAMAAESTQKLIEDLPNFTNVTPIIQFNTAIP